MKKIYSIILCLSLLVSCSYDDNELWDSVNNLQGTELDINLEHQDATLLYGESTTMKVVFTAVESYTISKPDGWKASIVGDVLTIESPAKDNQFAESEGKITIIALDDNNKTAIAELRVKAAYKTSVVSFEDAEGTNYWSSLIDDPQYGGDLLYADFSWADYKWTDKESGLYSTINEGEWGKVFWSGGIAISNYYSLDAETYGDYDSQLTVYGTSGNNDSKNCGVIFTPAYLDFADGVAKTIDHMYIAPTTYYYYVTIEGNELSAPVGENESVWLKATGYLNGKKVKTLTTYMVENGKSLVDTWTKWDLSDLGKVDKVELTMGGDTDNGYGFSIPAYFAIDDIMVVHN